MDKLIMKPKKGYYESDELIQIAENYERMNIAAHNRRAKLLKQLREKTYEDYALFKAKLCKIDFQEKLYDALSQWYISLMSDEERGKIYGY